MGVCCKALQLWNTLQIARQREEELERNRQEQVRMVCLRMYVLACVCVP